MAKANMTLPDGTVVTIEGSIDEIQKILAIHRPTETKNSNKPNKGASKKKREVADTNESDENINLFEIVNTIKNCDIADSIESGILDRTSQVDRVLLPLYISYKYYNDKLKLTSGEITKVLSDLGINIHIANVSNTLSNSAAKYVMGDKMKKKGQPVRYKLSRRGVQYIEAIIQGKVDE